MNNDRTAALRQRATHLTNIKTHASWPVVEQIVEGEIERRVRAFVSSPTLPYQSIDYARGEIHGMQAVLRIVRNGEQDLQKAIQAAQRMEGEA